MGCTQSMPMSRSMGTRSSTLPSEWNMTGFPARFAGAMIRASLGNHISRMIAGGRKRPVLNATSSPTHTKSAPFFTAASQSFPHQSALMSSSSSMRSRSSYTIFMASSSPITNSYRVWKNAANVTPRPIRVPDASRACRYSRT